MSSASKRRVLFVDDESAVLEVVREILAKSARPYRRPDAELPIEEQVARRGGHLLKAAIELDTLEAQGLSSSQALDAMKGRADQYDPDVLQALVEIRGSQQGGDTIRDVSLAALKPGMVFATDVKMTTGTLFVARGYEVTESFLERIKNFRPGSVKEPLKVVIRGTA